MDARSRACGRARRRDDLLLVLCWRLVQPFAAPLAWALALAVVAHPLHGWIARRIKAPGLAAGIAVFVIALVFAGS